MTFGVSFPICLNRWPTRGWFALLAVLLSMVGSMPANAQVTASATARAEAVVVQNLTFVKVDDLAFGRVVPGTTAGTVVLAPNGSRTSTGGVRLASGGSMQPASFAGKGSFNQQVTIRLATNTTTLNRVGGGGTMTVDTFIIGSTPTAQITTTPRTFRISNSSGIFLFPVGATLRVKANQAPGTYTGTFSITINYL